MRYSYVPGSSEAHDADVMRCPVCLTTYGGKVQPIEPEVVPLPLVPARPAQAVEEIADGNGQAMSTGRLAAKHGWQVTPWYAQAHDGAEMSALRMARADARGVVLWWRAPGENWSFDLAYGWLIGQPDTMTKLGIADFRKALAR
jgi:hypothetical protein